MTFRPLNILLLTDAPEHFSTVCRGLEPIRALAEAGVVKIAIESWPGPKPNESNPQEVEAVAAFLREEKKAEGGLKFHKSLIKHVAYADVVVIPMTAASAWYAMIPFFQSKGKVVVMDADDDSFAVNPASPSYATRGTKECTLVNNGKEVGIWQDRARYPADVDEEELSRRDPPVWLMSLERNQKLMASAEEAFRKADAITTTTERARNRFLDYNPNVYALPNSHDLTVYAPGRHPGRQGFRIGWYGGNSHFGDLATACKGLRRFLDEGHDDVVVVAMGNVPASLTKAVPPHQLELWDWTCPEAHPYRLMAMGFDMAFAAVEHKVKFNECKSQIKWSEMGACGVPVLCSRTPPYSDCVNDGVDGILVDETEEAWYQGFKTLYEDEALRKRMGVAANERIQKDYDLHRNAQYWYDVYDLLVKARHPVLNSAGEKAVP